MLIAGDIFDASPFASRRAFLEGLEALDGIPVYAVAGNHDFASLPRVARLDPRLRLLGGQGRWTSDRVAEGLEVVGWSFPDEHVSESSLRHLPPRGAIRRVGVLHGDVGPASRYHPVSESDLASPGADAWVLGHVHGHRTLAGGKAAYPGSPQALDPGETGRHGVLWLEDGPNGFAFSPLAPVSTILYDTVGVEVEAGGDAGIEELEDKLRELGSAERAASGHLKSCQWRVRLTFREGEAPQKDHAASLPPHDWYQVVQSSRALRLDLGLLSTRNDLAGAMARMLVALEQPEAAQPDWQEGAESLLDQAEFRLKDVHRKAWTGLDQIESVPRAPDSEQARRAAREALARITREQLAGLVREETR